MAEGARGGICSVDQIESFMVATPRHENSEHLAAFLGASQEPAPMPQVSAKSKRESTCARPS
jgi:hypothetical protein